MKTLYTIGFTKKTAEEFFTLLNTYEVKRIIDIRLINHTQFAIFTRYPDIEYFLRKESIEYVHDKLLAPTQEILNAYREKDIDWAEYVIQFNNLMQSRNIIQHIETIAKYSDFDKNCLLCAEDRPDFCHRRLVAELIQEHFENIKVHHIYI